MQRKRILVSLVDKMENYIPRLHNLNINLITKIGNPLSAPIQLSLITIDGKEIYQQKINEGILQQNISVENISTGTQ